MSLSNQHSTKKERDPRDSLKSINTSFHFNSYRSTQDDNSGQEWHDFAMVRPNEQPTSSNKSHRRTFQSSTLSEKQAVTIRKTKSLRESSRSKLRSPPPPKQSKSEIIDKLPFVRRNPSLSDKKRSVIELPTVFEKTPDDMPSVNKAFAEYQGYSRHSRHGSFTYSPPPTNPNETQVPDVPPVPKIHALKSRSSSLRKKKTSRPTSDMSNISNVNFYHDNNVSELQRELDRMLSDLPEPSVMDNMDEDLAQIEEDIKALALERDRHSSFIQNQNQKVTEPALERDRHSSFIQNQNQKVTEPAPGGRKRGKVRHF
jgi:hypothetical protein